MSKGSVIWGVLGGLAAGALMGVLLAPEKGSLTLQKMTDKGEDFGDELKHNLRELIDRVEEKMGMSKEDAMKMLVEKGKGFIAKEKDTINKTKIHYINVGHPEYTPHS